MCCGGAGRRTAPRHPGHEHDAIRGQRDAGVVACAGRSPAPVAPAPAAPPPAATTVRLALTSRPVLSLATSVWLPTSASVGMVTSAEPGSSAAGVTSPTDRATEKNVKLTVVRAGVTAPLTVIVCPGTPWCRSR